MPTIWNLVPMYPNPSHTTEKKKKMGKKHCWGQQWHSDIQNWCAIALILTAIILQPTSIWLLIELILFLDLMQSSSNVHQL